MLNIPREYACYKTFLNVTYQILTYTIEIDIGIAGNLEYSRPKARFGGIPE